MASRVTMIGSFPPPVGGAATVNQRIYSALLTSGISTRRLNTAGPTLHVKGIRYHVWRAIANAKALSSIIFAGGRVGYIVPDAGLGVWYSLMHIGLARWRFQRIVLHHHSFRYVNRQSVAMQAIVAWTARSRCTHVFLSTGMAERFKARYGPVASIIVTNAGHVAFEGAATVPAGRFANSGRIRIGHLSNLCREKGFFEVANTFEVLAGRGCDVELHLAGPIIEKAVSDRLEVLRERHGDRIFAYGPVSGEAKKMFYRGIDIFIFPTRFAQEAAPLVIFEAFAAGKPVIATQMGCIEEMVYGLRGVTISNVDKFPEAAAAEILRMELRSPSSAQRSRLIFQSFVEEATASKLHAGQLMALLCS